MRYIPTCVCAYAYKYVRAPVAHPRAHVGVLVFVCVQRERERGDRGELEGRRETEGREETGKREKEREREIMARRVDGKIIRAVDGRKLEGQREGSR